MWRHGQGNIGKNKRWKHSSGPSPPVWDQRIWSWRIYGQRSQNKHHVFTVTHASLRLHNRCDRSKTDHFSLVQITQTLTAAWRKPCLSELTRDLRRWEQWVCEFSVKLGMHDITKPPKIRVRNILGLYVSRFLRHNAFSPFCSLRDVFLWIHHKFSQDPVVLTHTRPLVIQFSAGFEFFQLTSEEQHLQS